MDVLRRGIAVVCLLGVANSEHCSGVSSPFRCRPCTAAVRGYCVATPFGRHGETLHGRRVLDSPCRHSGGHCGGSCGGSREYQATADRGGMFPDAGTHAIYATTSVESGTVLAVVVADGIVAKRADRGG